MLLLQQSIANPGIKISDDTVSRSPDHHINTHEHAHHDNLYSYSDKERQE